MKLTEVLDYTNLKPDGTVGHIEKLCDEARQHGCYAVCVLPYYVRAAAARLENSDVKICTVAGFPLGAHFVTAKLLECELSAQKGAHEIDAVVNLAAFKSGDFDSVREELRRLRELASLKNLTLKIIIESGALSLGELEKMCALCAEAEPDFVKTSTGYYNPGAELEKVTFMRQALPETIQIKAAGGIRTAEKARAFLAAGAARIGASTLLIEKDESVTP